MLDVLATSSLLTFAHALTPTFPTLVGPARDTQHRKILPKEIEKNWNQSQTDVKKWRCFSGFSLGLKALISEVTVVQQILALFLLCFSSFDLKNSKKNENINFRLMSLARASWSCITLLSHLKRKGAFISLSSLVWGKSLTFCTRTRSCARADDAKIVRSRNAQCKTKESP